MRSGPYAEPRPVPMPLAIAVLLILGLVLLAWAVVLAAMVGAIVLFGGWGPFWVVAACAAVWRGVR